MITDLITNINMITDNIANINIIVMINDLILII
jgi:hypothetical protein